MAGRIRREDVAAVRERVRIEDVVGEHVTLKPAGVGSMKGLCPFHDERSPSFHVRPQVGLWHCFGCSEGGDVISFLQKIDGLAFTEAVEHLAGRVGLQLRYEDGGAARPGEEPGRRQRMLEAHRVAAAYYAEQMVSPQAAVGRTFLAERGFDRSAAEQFGIGFAPAGWDHLLRHLRGRGYTEAELVATGLMSQGNRGLYDRFRGRLVWPIRDVTGDVVGFGARRLLEEDQGPKYLNSPETALYKKAQVLYGIDLAKREIAKSKQVVVVEGYTDVMAAHLSGVPTAVATCGTAFGPDHARIVRQHVGEGETMLDGVHGALIDDIMRRLPPDMLAEREHHPLRQEQAARHVQIAAHPVGIDDQPAPVGLFGQPVKGAQAGGQRRPCHPVGHQFKGQQQPHPAHVTDKGEPVHQRAQPPRQPCAPAVQQRVFLPSGTSAGSAHGFSHN